jgi:hypothetical protein
VNGDAVGGTSATTAPTRLQRKTFRHAPQLQEARDYSKLESKAGDDGHVTAHLASFHGKGKDNLLAN